MWRILRRKQRTIVQARTAVHSSDCELSEGQPPAFRPHPTQTFIFKAWSNRMQRSLRFSGILVIGAFLALTGTGNASTFKVIYTFAGGNSDGYLPTAGLTRDKAGNLYGTTAAGGPQNGGTVFELSPGANGTWKEKILYSFTYGADGGSPFAGVVLDSQGNLYGTTEEGGIASSNCGGGSCGVVYELSPGSNGWKENVLYSFTGAGDGATPMAPVVLDSAGNIYGTATGGGSFVGCYYGCGVAFELEKASGWTEKVLHTFAAYPTDGSNPGTGLQFDAKGNLVGTTPVGGVGPCCGGYNGGIVFQLNPGSSGDWNETILYTFCAETNCADGTGPSGLVVSGTTLYGAAGAGGATGGGVWYHMSDSIGAKPSEYSFGGNDGAGPIAPIVLRQGKIFGVTENGGITTNTCAPFQGGNGVVYELTQSNGKLTETVLHSFTGGNDGCIPQGNLIADPSGNLYGTTYEGGKKGFGVVFEVTP
jgi:uncharacterized repeat protein (TIGR03803 family)